MPDHHTADTLPAEQLLADAVVDDAVFALRPDYRALLIVVEGLRPVDSSPAVDGLVAEAESHAGGRAAGPEAHAVPHIEAWREAYRSFGAKPTRTRNSLEALTRRAPDGLPRINPLTDAYNAVSVLHEVPIGGEDLDRYRGAPRLVRAVGDESFDTVSGGEHVIEHPAPGEIVWCDDEGVTCRRWNWRQGRRTALTGGTRRALFIFDALSPISDEALEAAGEALLDVLGRLGPEMTAARRLIRP